MSEEQRGRLVKVRVQGTETAWREAQIVLQVPWDASVSEIGSLDEEVINVTTGVPWEIVRFEDDWQVQPFDNDLLIEIVGVADDVRGVGEPSSAHIELVRDEEGKLVIKQ